ncbi:hypothetical protein PAPYR_5370 [Paratrimastix pyriformis]|uniref:Uncharacterized protein n=1 Tax=Paratrimastix pyriformis TaxID=342808 RepID=A0ABQ8UJ60_9EUKA|nr:hypothetical protein PAPYR_5370 [Paratrimastix pyriformis]
MFSDSFPEDLITVVATQCRSISTYILLISLSRKFRHAALGKAHFLCFSTGEEDEVDDGQLALTSLPSPETYTALIRPCHFLEEVEFSRLGVLRNPSPEEAGWVDKAFRHHDYLHSLVIPCLKGIDLHQICRIFVHCSRLEIVRISSADKVDLVPTDLFVALGGLAGLREFVWDLNTGTKTVSFDPLAAACPTLQRVSLKGNSCEGVIEQLPFLESFASDGFVDIAPESLAPCSSNLRTFEMPLCTPRRFLVQAALYPRLATLTLDMGSIRFSDFALIGALSQLRRLTMNNVRDCYVHPLGQMVAGMSQLRALTLATTSLVPWEGLERLLPLVEGLEEVELLGFWHTPLISLAIRGPRMRLLRLQCGRTSVCRVAGPCLRLLELGPDVFEAVLDCPALEVSSALPHFVCCHPARGPLSNPGVARDRPLAALLAAAGPNLREVAGLTLFEWPLLERLCACPELVALRALRVVTDALGPSLSLRLGPRVERAEVDLSTDEFDRLELAGPAVRSVRLRVLDPARIDLGSCPWLAHLRVHRRVGGAGRLEELVLHPEAAMRTLSVANCPRLRLGPLLGPTLRALHVEAAPTEPFDVTPIGPLLADGLALPCLRVLDLVGFVGDALTIRLRRLGSLRLATRNLGQLELWAPPLWRLSLMDCPALKDIVVPGDFGQCLTENESPYNLRRKLNKARRTVARTYGQ